MALWLRYGQDLPNPICRVLWVEAVKTPDRAHVKVAILW